MLSLKVRAVCPMAWPSLLLSSPRKNGFSMKNGFSGSVHLAVEYAIRIRIHERKRGRSFVYTSPESRPEHGLPSIRDPSPLAVRRTAARCSATIGARPGPLALRSPTGVAPPMLWCSNSWGKPPWMMPSSFLMSQHLIAGDRL